MEAILFIGLPGCGKSSLYREQFFSTHVRISLDLLKTRFRERTLINACLSTQQPFVVDNTNPTREERLQYLEPARASGFRTVGFYFESRVEDCLGRNSSRTGTARVPDVAILSAAKRLQVPTLAEGFDELFYVRLAGGGFAIEEWRG